MMKLRVLVIALVALFVCSTAVMAQNANQQQGPGAHPVLGRMARQIGLSQDQVKQIAALVKQYHEDVANVLKSSASNDDKKAQVKDIRMKAGSAIMAVMSTEQQEKAKKLRFVDLLLEPAARVRFAIELALAQLDLTDQQKTTIKGIFQDFDTAAKAIRDDSSIDQTAKRAKLMQLRKDTESKVIAVLTPEQQQKLKEIMKRRARGNA